MSLWQFIDLVNISQNYFDFLNFICFFFVCYCCTSLCFMCRWWQTFYLRLRRVNSHTFHSNPSKILFSFILFLVCHLDFMFYNSFFLLFFAYDLCVCVCVILLDSICWLLISNNSMCRHKHVFICNFRFSFWSFLYVQHLHIRHFHLEHSRIFGGGRWKTLFAKCSQQRNKNKTNV